MKGPKRSSRFERTPPGVALRSTCWPAAALLVAVTLAGILGCADPDRRRSPVAGPHRGAAVLPSSQMSGLPPDGFVDRVEGAVAVIVTDDDRVVHWPSFGLREGDVLREGRPDPAARAELLARIRNLRSRLGEHDDAPEDLEL